MKLLGLGEIPEFDDGGYGPDIFVKLVEDTNTVVLDEFRITQV